ncbi:uncharacterized protein TrAtP1_010678 [Trichoderma atroviride]|uniref:uncharacterized protein n=1 Tax=Hypocrea atroviridis TaxID=63577 RepID=UPI003324510C|nr:hypothetical protein TrAtP1_010678 [Trichoderma atroviride]
MIRLALQILWMESLSHHQNSLVSGSILWMPLNMRVDIIISTASGIIDESLYFSTPTKQILRYVADRTGIISFANFPFIWLFGMRNNLALWLTGWDFGTYNNFHRWVARISTAEAIIHSVLYTVLIFMNGGLNYYAWWFTMWFWNAGQMATIFIHPHRVINSHIINNAWTRFNI